MQYASLAYGDGRLWLLSAIDCH